jgi:hypothetical protein
MGIDRKETIRFNEEGAEFLFYHNGTYNRENPYKYEIKNDNVW